MGGQCTEFHWQSCRVAPFVSSWWPGVGGGQLGASQEEGLPGGHSETVSTGMGTNPKSSHLTKRKNVAEINTESAKAQPQAFWVAQLVKNPRAGAGDTGNVSTVPWSGRSPGGGWQPTPVFLPGESHGHRSLAGIVYIVHGVADCQT